MRPIIGLLTLPVQIGMGAWALLWGWTYPLARPAISEARSAPGGDRQSLRSLAETMLFALELPFMARSQHCAERSAETRTINLMSEAPVRLYAAQAARWLQEPAWRTHVREAMVWSTAISWLVTWGCIGASFIFTGNFLFEAHATPDSPGYVTPYFEVAALTFALPFAWVSAIAVTLGLTRRSN